MVCGKAAKKLSMVLEEDVWCLAGVDLSCGRGSAVLERIVENEEGCAILKTPSSRNHEIPDYSPVLVLPCSGPSP